MYLNHSFSISSISFGCISVHNFCSGLKQRVFISWLLSARNLGENKSSCSGLGFLIRLQSRCWLSLQSSEGLTGVGRSVPKAAYSHGCWLESSVPCWLLKVASISLHVDLCIGLLKCPYDMVTGFPPGNWSNREQGGWFNVFYNLPMEVPQYHFHGATKEHLSCSFC